MIVPAQARAELDEEIVSPRRDVDHPVHLTQVRVRVRISPHPPPSPNPNPNPNLNPNPNPTLILTLTLTKSTSLSGLWLSGTIGGKAWTRAAKARSSPATSRAPGAAAGG